MGIYECDELLQKLAACAANQKESRRRHIEKLLPVYRDPWVKDAKDPEKRGTVTRSCLKAAHHFRITLAEIKCDL